MQRRKRRGVSSQARWEGLRRMQGMNNHHNSNNNLKRGLDASVGWPSQGGLRLKSRGVLGKRAAPTTPVPSWKVFNNQLYDGIAAAAAAHIAAGKPVPLSARKLAASLWELQELPLPDCLCSSNNNCASSPPHHHHHHHQNSSRVKELSELSSPLSQADGYLSPRSFDNHHSLKSGSENGKRSGQGNKQNITGRGHLHRLLNKRDEPGSGRTPSHLHDGQRQQPLSSSTSEKKGTGKPAHRQTTTSSKLLKVLSRIRLLEEQHSTAQDMTYTLRSELDQALARVQELELAQKSTRRECKEEIKRMTDERASWKAKEQEKMKAAMEAVKAEIEEERKARRKIEAISRKMGKELMEANMATAKAVQELEQERKSRRLMEDVCDELAREIGDDKAEVEELKRESEKVREELEEERRMLQLAEVWREERVQMKLGEAKLALEEKSAALDVMRGELESFLKGKLSPTISHTAVEEAQVLRNVITAIHPKGLVSSFPPAEIMEAVSPDHDLYTVELSHDMNHDEPGDSQYWGDPIDSQELGSHWDGDGADDTAVDYPANRLWTYPTTTPEHIHRRSAENCEDPKEGDSGSEYVVIETHSRRNLPHHMREGRGSD